MDTNVAKSRYTLVKYDDVADYDIDALSKQRRRLNFFSDEDPPSRHTGLRLPPHPLGAVRILEKHAAGRAAASGGVIQPVGMNVGIQAVHRHHRTGHHIPSATATPLPITT